MKEKREKIVNNAFGRILTMCDILGGEITEANRYESGWVRVKCKHKETGLEFEFSFEIEKISENEGEQKWKTS